MSEYKINTGTIINKMSSNFAQFDIEFLQNEFFNSVIYSLKRKKVKATIAFDEENRQSLERYNEQYKNDINKLDSDFNFKDSVYPFPDYFMRVLMFGKERVKELVELNTSCIINKNDDWFDMFFAYQLNLTDLVEIDKFLDYHLKKTFKNNFSEFESFLSKILLKYKSFLEEKQKPLVEHFLKKIEPIKTTESPHITNKDFTIGRQVLAIHYLLKSIDEKYNSDIDKTNIARFIQFLTGREIGAKNIANTEIYKRINVIFSKNDKTLEKDLQFLRIYFEKLNLKTIVNQINIEISNKE